MELAERFVKTDARKKSSGFGMKTAIETKKQDDDGCSQSDCVTNCQGFT